MTLVRVARAEEVPPGHTRFVLAGERPLVLANWDGRIFALDGLCPHQRFPLEGAQLWDHLLTCPWHNYQFDVRTGENYYPKNVYPPDLGAELAALRRYPVEVRDGAVWVDLENTEGL